MTDLITYDDVLAKLREVVAEHPDRINPLGEVDGVPNACRYTHPRNPSYHCLAGELLTRFGCRLPREGALVGASPDRDRFTFTAQTLLSVVQHCADRDYVQNGVRVSRATPWAVAWHKLCREERLDPWTGEPAR